ncbi:hypothetical protein LshimejAT787_1100240 [Lyophyllum shimeji]|uniref:PAS domain-containing protein n=1 Tax=Lyophyllum shimeji TaxID=47721 RepID=A0A9P3UNV2_LYOSH|nr:hypothetical protein LshimejAT787_1100240 [Lyophyllum shimeji]
MSASSAAADETTAADQPHPHGLAAGTAARRAGKGKEGNHPPWPRPRHAEAVLGKVVRADGGAAAPVSVLVQAEGEQEKTARMTYREVWVQHAGRGRSAWAVVAVSAGVDDALGYTAEELMGRRIGTRVVEGGEGYCSTDIRDVVQRHLRHTGERDTRGPADFSDAAGGAKHATSETQMMMPRTATAMTLSHLLKRGVQEERGLQAFGSGDQGAQGLTVNLQRASCRGKCTVHSDTAYIPPIPHDPTKTNNRTKSAWTTRPTSTPPTCYVTTTMDIPCLPPPTTPCSVPLRSRGGLGMRNLLPATPGIAQFPPAPTRVPALRRPPVTTGTSRDTTGIFQRSLLRLSPRLTNLLLGSRTKRLQQHASAGGYYGNTDSRFARGDDGRDTSGAGDDKASRESFASAFPEAEQQRKGVGVGVVLPRGGLSLPPPPCGATATATSAASFGPRLAHPRSASASMRASGASAGAGGDAQQDSGGVGWLDLLSAGTPGTTVPSGSEGTALPSPRSGSADTPASGAAA